MSRPNTFVTSDVVITVLENSIKSLENFHKMCDDDFADTEQRIKRIEKLMEIIVILHWTFESSAIFKFTMKHDIKGTKPLSEFYIPDENDDTWQQWKDRVLIELQEDDFDYTKIFIRF